MTLNSSLDRYMHAGANWLPMTGNKTVVATDDRLCIGDFPKAI